MLLVQSPPLRVQGVQMDMMGPASYQTFGFDRPGWVTDFETYQMQDGRLLQTTEFLCHSDVIYSRVHLKQPVMTIDLDEGNHHIHLPDGFGFPVYSNRMYAVGMMLKNADPNLDTTLESVTKLTVHYADKESPPLKSLVQFPLHPPVKQKGLKTLEAKDWYVWWMNAGHHQLEGRMTVPISGRVHFITVHLHRYATEVLLSDAKTGTVLFQGKTREDAERNLIATPFYSDVQGFPIKADQPLNMTITYDVPTGVQAVAMGTFHLFIHPDNEDDPAVKKLAEFATHDPSREADAAMQGHLGHSMH